MVNEFHGEEIFFNPKAENATAYVEGDVFLQQVHTHTSHHVMLHDAHACVYKCARVCVQVSADLVIHVMSVMFVANVTSFLNFLFLLCHRLQFDLNPTRFFIDMSVLAGMFGLFGLMSYASLRFINKEKR